MIYTSYFAKVPQLIERGIEPIAVSRGVPKNWRHRRALALAPSWAMLNMTDEEYDAEYDKILERNDPHKFVEWLGDGDVALLCWEKNPCDCHRLKIAAWLVKNGYQVQEFDPSVA